MRRHPTIALLVLIPVLALLASCGTSGGNDAADTDAKTSTTTAAGDDGGGDRPTSADLVDLLPTADEIGPGYTMSDESLGDEADESDDQDGSDGSDEERDPTEQAMIDQCPGAKFLEELDDSGTSTTEVSREFENADEATIEVALDPKPPKFTEETVGKIVDALADCGTIEATDDGATIEMTMTAEEYDEHGDFGVSVAMDAEYTTEGITIPIAFRGVIFSVDGTSVSVVATSGLDKSYEQVPGDYDLLPELAATMEERVASL